MRNTVLGRGGSRRLFRGRARVERGWWVRRSCLWKWVRCAWKVNGGFDGKGEKSGEGWMKEWSEGVE